MAKTFNETLDLAEKIVKGDTTSLTTQLSTLLDRILQYLQAFAPAPSMGSFRRKQYLRQDLFKNVLLKILSLPVTQFNSDDLTLLLKILSFFLHSDTDQEFRLAVIVPFLHWAALSPPDILSAVSSLFPAIIPYPKFARTEAECKAVTQTFLKGSIGIQSKKSSSPTVAQGLEQMCDLTLCVQSDWREHELFASTLLLEGILFPVWRAQANRLQLCPWTTGFAEPVIDDFILIVFGFLRSFEEANLSIMPLMATLPKARFFFWIIKQAAKSDTEPDIACAIHALTRIVTNPTIIKSLLKPDAKLILKPMMILGKSLKPTMPIQLKEKANSFMSAFFEVAFRCAPFPEISELFSERSVRRFRPFSSASLFAGLVHFALTTAPQNEALRHLIYSRMVASVVHPVVVMRYGQYLAALRFPHVLKYRLDEVDAQFAARIVFRTATQELNIFDWTVDSFKTISTSPREFVKDLPFEWPPFKEIDPTVHAVLYPELVFKSKDQIEKAVEWFKLLLGDYILCELLPMRNIFFSAIHGYYDLLARMMVVPPEVRGDFNVAFEEVLHGMMAPFLSNAGSLIEEYAFRTLSKLLINRNLIIRINQIDFSRILLITASYLLSNSGEVTNLAVGLTWRFIEIGMPGAQLLVPIMFAVIEKKENLTKDDIDFLSSLALFHIETPIPSIVIETITTRFNNDPSCFTNHTKEIIELLKSPGDLIARVYTIAANLHRRAGYESDYWGIVVPFFTAILVDNVLDNEPNQQMVIASIAAIYESVQRKCSQGLLAVELLIPYFTRIAQICEQVLLTFVDDLLHQVVAGEIGSSTLWVIQLSRTIVQILVTHHEIAKQVSGIPKFVETLSLWYHTKTSLPSECLDAIEILETYLAINLSRYPFPDGSSFPSNICETETKNLLLFKIQESVLLSIRENPGEKVDFEIQTVVGHFRWTASNLTAGFLQEFDLPPIELPVLQSIEDIAPISDRSSQHKFSEKLQNHYQQYKETDLDAINDDLQDVLQEVHSSVGSLSIRPPKPRTTPLGALTGFGLTEDFNFNRIPLTDDDIRSKFSKLTAKTIRLKTTASVLYLSDIATASVAQAIKFPLESTSLHYREFLTGLGWTVDLQLHRGFSGGLKSRTSIYYSDCFHELMWHVGGLIEEQSEVIVKDQIHVIWCDGNFDFSSFATPMGDGKAFIIIHPLPVGLFFVKIILANGIPANPGFVKNLVIAKKALPVFVRQTVLGIRISVMDAVSPFQIPPGDISNELHSFIREFVKERNMIPSELLLELLTNLAH